MGELYGALLQQRRRVAIPPSHWLPPPRPIAVGVWHKSRPAVLLAVRVVEALGLRCGEEHRWFKTLRVVFAFVFFPPFCVSVYVCVCLLLARAGHLSSVYIIRTTEPAGKHGLGFSW